MDKALDIHLFDIGGTPITLATAITFFAILAVSVVLAKVAEKLVAKALRLRRVPDEGSLAVARRLVHYAVLLTGFAVGLDTVGINLGALFAAGALFAVALGFAMQNIAQNFVAGVILLVERTIKPGDVLEVEGKVVRVVVMGIRATISRTLDEEEIIIPNSVLVQTTVKNYTLSDPLYRLRASVGVAYSSDLKRVREALEAAARRSASRVADLEPRILLKEFGPSSVNFEVSVWIDDPWRSRSRLSELQEQIWWSLKEAGIVIAFPQLDLHVDERVLEALRPRLPAA
jgi:small-conductance mechanosensitive channel